jgi:hypothetical protein
LSDPAPVAEVRFYQVVIDCADPRTLADFWMTEASAKEIEGMGRGGGRWVSEDPEDPLVVLADPEGNEFCIVRPKG